MKPRFAADYRLLFWMFVLVPAMPALALWRPALAPWLLPLTLYLAYCTGIASHWHNHCPTFGASSVNRAYGAWLSIFYGTPIFAWVPTHNQNHHKFINGEGDCTRTSRYAKSNDAWYALTYPFASAAYQLPSVWAFARRVSASGRKGFGLVATQLFALAGAHFGFVLLATRWHGVGDGLLAYCFALGLPAGFATWSMMFTNFLQHVDCDAGSVDNHSRNFTSAKLNWFVFDSGFHTVHHEHPGTHWSKYAALHEARKERIDPALEQESIGAYCWSTYACKHLRADEAVGFRSRRLDGVPTVTSRPRAAAPEGWIE